jgi:hypothetical protein
VPEAVFSYFVVREALIAADTFLEYNWSDRPAIMLWRCNT